MDLTELETQSFWAVRQELMELLAERASGIFYVREGSFYGAVIPLGDAAAILAGLIKGPAQK